MRTFRKLPAWVLLAALCWGAGAARADNRKVRPLHVGLVVSDLRNPFFMRIARAVESRTGTASPRSARLTVVSSGFDPIRQAEQFDALIRQRADLIIVTPIDPARIAVQIAAAHAAGIKVVALDAAARGADLTVMTDNVRAGKMACDHLARKLRGQGEVAIIHGPSNSAIVERVRGCRDALDGFAGLRLVSEALDGGASKEGGLEQMTRLLASFPRLAGVFTINDPTALGAELAARASGRNDVVIVTIDGSPEVVRRLRDDGSLDARSRSARSLVCATAAQAPAEMGRRAVELGIAMVKGRAPAERLVMLAPTLVTRDNAEAYPGW
jgi:ribose transport system substrate-binding protein